MKLRIFSCIKEILVYCKGPPYFKKEKKKSSLCSIIVLLILFLQTLSCAFSMRRMDSIMEVSSPSCLLHTRAHLHFGGGQIAYSKFHQEKCNHLSSKGSRRQIDMTMRSGAKDGIFLRGGEKIKLVCIIFFQNARTRR